MVSEHKVSVMNEEQIKLAYHRLAESIKSKPRIRLKADGKVEVNGKPCKGCAEKRKKAG